MVHYANRKRIKPGPKPKRPQTATQPQPTPLQLDETPAFEVREIPNKGKGLVATRNIKAGELILRESPIMMIDFQTTGDVVFDAYNQLSTDDKKLYDSLHCPNNSWVLPNFLIICKANAVALGDGKKGGVFVKGSRINHSCTPNCSQWWDEKEGVQITSAMKDIKEGEEWTMGYVEVLTTKEERQKKLRKDFNFECKCEVCLFESEEEEEALASDTFRLGLREMIDSFKKPAKLVDPVKFVQDVNLALSLMEEEGLVLGQLGLALEALSACAWNGDRQNSILWIDKAIELARCEHGVWSTVYKNLQGWKGRPSKYPEWNGSVKNLGKVKALLGPE